MDQRDIVDELASLRAEVTQLREERIPRVDRSSRRRDRRLTLAYVLMTAVVVGVTSVGSASALDGTNTVFSDDIVDGTVSSLDLKNNSVITSDIKDDSIAGRDVATGSIDGTDVKDDSITGLDVGTESLYGTDVADGSLTHHDIQDDTIGTDDIRDSSLGTADIADGGVTGDDVSNGSLTGADIDLFNDNACSGETILGTALINADPAVPYTETTAWIGYPHSCSGQSVLVRRQGVGQYIVRFAGSPARLAVATSSKDGTMVSITNTVNPGEFFIISRKVSDGWLVDEDFTVLAY